MRHGGVSRAPYHSLNCSFKVGDGPERVSQNLAIVQAHMGAERLVFMNQVHGTRVEVIGEHGSDREPAPEADALMTDRPGTALLVKLADCQSVMIFDPERRAAAIVHCGWRGNVANILGETVRQMVSIFGSRPSALVAAISPSLGPCCAEFVTYREIFPPGFIRFMVGENRFDLWALSIRQLMDAGLMRKNIELAGICTRCRTDLFFSYRGEGRTGRFAAAIMIEKEPE